MKKVIVGLSVIGMVILSNAQENTDNKGFNFKKEQKDKINRRPNKMERMKQELGLSEAQITQINKLNEERKKRAKNEREKERVRYEKEMKKVLTPEQFKQWEELKTKQIEKMKDRKNPKRHLSQK